MTRVAFREQMLRAREDAIVASASRLLAEKGFDTLTVDEVAADVGIAKASLYKHFGFKEALAAAAMVRVLDRALAFVQSLQTTLGAAAIDQLKAVVRWAMQLQLVGEMPSLPAQNSTLRAALTGHRVYVERLMAVSDALGAWIAAAGRPAISTRGCRPKWCCTRCTRAPAIRCPGCSGSAGSTPTSR